MPELTLTDAVAIVARDQRESYPDETITSVVTGARDTLTLPDAPYVPGGFPIYDDGTIAYPAYVAVLSASDRDVAMAIYRHIVTSVGLGFHPDTTDYLSLPDGISQSDINDAVSVIGRYADPYELALDILT